MDITDALLGEHAALYELFDHSRDVASRGGGLAELKATVAAVDRLLVSHARLEEELLFPRLEPFLGPMGPLAVMLSEHRGIDELLEAVRRETDAAALADLVHRLIELSAGHFRKEEMVLFGMARRFLDRDTLDELGAEWAAARNVALGGGCVAAG